MADVRAEDAATEGRFYIPVSAGYQLQGLKGWESFDAPFGHQQTNFTRNDGSAAFSLGLGYEQLFGDWLLGAELQAMIAPRKTESNISVSYISDGFGAIRVDHLGVSLKREVSGIFSLVAAMPMSWAIPYVKMGVVFSSFTAKLAINHESLLGPGLNNDSRIKRQNVWGVRPALGVLWDFPSFRVGVEAAVEYYPTPIRLFYAQEDANAMDVAVQVQGKRSNAGVFATLQFKL